MVLVKSVIKLRKEEYVFELNIHTALTQQETFVFHATRYVAQPHIPSHVKCSRNSDWN